VAKLLVGNKTDLPNRVVSTETGKVFILILFDINTTSSLQQEFANGFNLRFFEASAKDGSNVEKCFQELVRDIYDAKVGKGKTGNSTSTGGGQLLTFDQPPSKPAKKRCLLL